MDQCIPADLPVGTEGGKGQGLHRGAGRSSELVTCLVTPHISFPKQFDTCHCENFSPEQIWRDSEHKGLLINGSHPEVAERVWGD